MWDFQLDLHHRPRDGLGFPVDGRETGKTVGSFCLEVQQEFGRFCLPRYPSWLRPACRTSLTLLEPPPAATIKDAARIKERHRRTTGSAHSTADGTNGATSEEIRSMGLYLAKMPCRVVHKLKPRFVQPRLGLTGDGC